jgi:hypothetical protein
MRCLTQASVVQNNTSASSALPTILALAAALASSTTASTNYSAGNSSSAQVFGLPRLTEQQQENLPAQVDPVLSPESSYGNVGGGGGGEGLSPRGSNNSPPPSSPMHLSVEAQV